MGGAVGKPAVTAGNPVFVWDGVARREPGRAS